MTERCEALLYPDNGLMRCERPRFHSGQHATEQRVWTHQGIGMDRCQRWERQVGRDVFGNEFRIYCVNESKSWMDKDCKGEHAYDTVACYAQDHSRHLDAERDAFDAWLERFRPTPFDLDVWRKAFLERPIDPSNHWHANPAFGALVAVLKFQGIALPERYDRGGYGQKRPLPDERMRRLMHEANIAEATAQRGAR